MKTLLKLQKGIIYGPVHSRRLGLSLGINLLPDRVKACPFNCVYCQYGWTDIHRATLDSPLVKINWHFSIPSALDVSRALSEALPRLVVKPAYITFSGNGEPTLHPDFGLIVEEATAIRNELAPQAKTAILSNSALAPNKSTQKALAKLDSRIMKLDCGSPLVFKRFNQPCKTVTLEAITQGLIELAGLAPVTIQTLIASGRKGNFEENNLRDWVKRLKRIRPIFVQIYTLDRGHPAQDLRPATPRQLRFVRDIVVKEGISCGIY